MQNGDKSQDTSAPNTVVQPGQEIRVSATGRSDSPSGTEGTIYIKSKDASKQLAVIEFDCPWGSSNSLKIVTKEPNVFTSQPGWNKKGALGELYITFVQI